MPAGGDIRRMGYQSKCAWRLRLWAGESLRCEDPAPTVGIGEEAVLRYSVYQPRPLQNPLNDAAFHIATVFGKCKGLIKILLPTRMGKAK